MWLRAWEADDAEQLAQACDDPEIARWLSVPSPYTVEAARAYLRMVGDWWRNGDQYSLAVTDGSAILGAISIRPNADQPSIGYWLARSARGRGLATRAVEAIAAWGVASFALRELWIFAQPANTASSHVAMRAGFVEQPEQVTFPDGKQRAVFRRSFSRGDEPTLRRGSTRSLANR